MKIKTYQKKHGVFNISCDIHLDFSRKNSLEGHFCLKDLNVDAKACFEKGLVHTDFKEFVKLLDESVANFIKKNEFEKARHEKLIYVRYSSSSRFFPEKEPKSVDLNLSYEIFDTYWNDRILLKVVNMEGREITIEHNSPVNFRGDTETIPYSPEAELFLKELVGRISEAQAKLQNFFERDYFNKNDISLNDKIKLLINADQKLLG